MRNYLVIPAGKNSSFYFERRQVAGQPEVSLPVMPEGCCQSSRTFSPGHLKAVARQKKYLSPSCPKVVVGHPELFSRYIALHNITGLVSHP